MNPELERIANGLDDLIPKEVDILHEIKSDRIFCSRQAVVNFIRTALTEAYELGRKEGDQHQLNLARADLYDGKTLEDVVTRLENLPHLR